MTAVAIGLCHAIVGGVPLTAQALRWTEVITRPQNVPMRSVAMFNCDTGVAVGSFGICRRTTDGGSSWSVTRTGVDQELTDIAVLEAGMALAVGYDGAIIRTTDYGVRWQTLEPCGPDSLVAIAATSAWCVAVGARGTVAVSRTNGGDWSVESVAEACLRDVAISRSVAITVGENGTILRSLDSGRTWAAVESGTEAELSAVVHVVDRHWIVACQPNIVLLSYDDGLTWRSSAVGVPFVFGKEFRFIGFFDQSRGILGLLDPELHHNLLFATTDAGSTWTQLPARQPEQLVSPYSRGFARCSGTSALLLTDAAAYRTDSYGHYWQSVQLTTTAQYWCMDWADSVHGVAIAGENSGWGVDVGPRVVADITTDGGRSWTQSIIEPETWAAYSDVEFVSPTVIIAVGDSGRVNRSTDAGRTWREITSRRGISFGGVDFVDSVHGVISGGQGIVLLTSDGGESWREVRMAPLALSEVAYLRVGHWLAVRHSQSGYVEEPLLVLSTTDTGATWVQSSFGDSPAQDVGRDSLGRAWMAGSRRGDASRYDQIVRSTVGGSGWDTLYATQTGVATRLLNRIAVGPGGIAVATGGRGRDIALTRDDGRSWTWVAPPIPAPTEASFTGISIPSILHGYVTTTPSRMFRFEFEVPASAGRQTVPDPVIRIHPNPASAVVNVSLPAVSRLTITNALGQTIRQISVSGRSVATFDVADWPAGVYWVWGTSGQRPTPFVVRP